MLLFFCRRRSPLFRLRQASPPNFWCPWPRVEVSGLWAYLAVLGEACRLGLNKSGPVACSRIFELCNFRDVLKDTVGFKIRSADRQISSWDWSLIKCSDRASFIPTGADRRGFYVQLLDLHAELSPKLWFSILCRCLAWPCAKIGIWTPRLNVCRGNSQLGMNWWFSCWVPFKIKLKRVPSKNHKHRRYTLSWLSVRSIARLLALPVELPADFGGVNGESYSFPKRDRDKLGPGVLVLGAWFTSNQINNSKLVETTPKP